MISNSLPYPPWGPTFGLPLGRLCAGVLPVRLACACCYVGAVFVGFGAESSVWPAPGSVPLRLRVPFGSLSRVSVRQGAHGFSAKMCTDVFQCYFTGLFLACPVCGCVESWLECTVVELVKKKRKRNLTLVVVCDMFCDIVCTLNHWSRIMVLDFDFVFGGYFCK